MVDPSARNDDGLLVLDGLLNRRPEFGAETWPSHGHQIERGMSRRNPQVAVGGTQREEALMTLIDEHSRRRISVQDHASAKFGETRLTRGRHALFEARDRSNTVARAERNPQVARSALADLSIEPFGLCDGFEAVREASYGLGATQEQEAARTKSEVKKSHHLGLRLGTQINQEVTA